jgi:hypothetical protein
VVIAPTLVTVSYVELPKASVYVTTDTNISVGSLESCVDTLAGISNMD